MSSDSEKNFGETQENQNMQDTAVQNDNKQEGACDQVCGSLKNQLLRVSADFQNFKNRVEKERMQYIQVGQVSVLEKLLPIVDDVDRALEEAKKNNVADGNWLSGFDMIANSFYKLLADCNIKSIEQIKVFDPELHEALAQVDAQGYISGDIVQVTQKGFMIGDRVLRPAKVIVAK